MFIQSIPEKVCDPVTGVRANNETELSALFSFYHSVGLIDWKTVNLYPLPYQSSKQCASELIDRSIPFFCEYPLFSNAQTVDIWGQMPADLLCFTEKGSTIILVENKIGSKFTSGGTQLMRQAKYLESTHYKNKNLIVLTSEIFLTKGWYLKEMQEVVEKVKGVNVFAVHWEEIFGSIKHSS